MTAADYDAWKSKFGSTMIPAADGNRDGIVDAADYTIWRDRMSTGAVSHASAIVPEPTSIVAALAALLVTVHILRARRLAF